MAQELHQLRAFSTDAQTLEKVNESFVVEGLLNARQKTIDVMHEIREALVPGLTEDDARKLALLIFHQHGVTKHWHKPYIRFGRGTTLTFNEPLQPDYRLQDNDPLYIDLGPAWPDEDGGLVYEGDVGDTFVAGENPEAEACASAARAIFALGREKWLSEQCTGVELYRSLKEETEARGYIFSVPVVGHRLSDFPHHQYSRERLAACPFCPSPNLWVLEIQIMRPDMSSGAFYEDLLMKTDPSPDPEPAK